MKRQRSNYPVKLMARVLKVSRSGFYAWLKRPLSNRALSDQAIKPLIKAVHIRSRETYGPRRLQDELASQGIIISRDRIGRLRKEMGLKCKQCKKFKATTNSKHDLPVEPNLLSQEFSVNDPGTVFGTDITYIPTNEGWLYLAGVKDFRTREIIGYDMNEGMTKDLVIVPLKKLFVIAVLNLVAFTIRIVDHSTVRFPIRRQLRMRGCVHRCHEKGTVMIMRRQRVSGER